MPRALVLAPIAAIQCLSACAPHDPRATSVLALSGDAARGRALYAQTCASCHRGDARWRLTLQLYGPDGFVSTIIDGVPKTKMPSFRAWTDQQLADVHAFIQTRQ
jgi:mono/diheme cytochrome c family protein